MSNDFAKSVSENNPEPEELLNLTKEYRKSVERTLYYIESLTNTLANLNPSKPKNHIGF
jgi:hypothetical protein